MEHLAPTDVNNLPLHEITRRLGEAGLRERLHNIVAESDEWSADQKTQVMVAEEIALAAHAGDMRGEQPYSTHFLRVAIRIASPGHIGVNDPNLVTAALLHDTVEDHAEYYSAGQPDLVPSRAGSLSVIDATFGQHVADMVDNVTNHDYPTDANNSRDARNNFYREHVIDVLHRDQDAGIIKLSDFIDNCAGLRHNEDPARAKRLAAKYRPLIPHFVDFVTTNTRIPESNKEYLTNQLLAADKLCEYLITQT